MYTAEREGEGEGRYVQRERECACQLKQAQDRYYRKRSCLHTEGRRQKDKEVDKEVEKKDRNTTVGCMQWISHEMRQERATRLELITAVSE